MSAIWGTVSFANSIPENANQLMRNPYETKCRIDRIESVKSDSCYMGCGIQYITPTAEHEVLPFYDDEKQIYFTADCILDNRDELISMLQANPAEPDGSLVYLAYLKWGIDCLKNLRGLFSIAVYDTKLETLFLATDQTASRCLYYYHRDNTICFSTLLAPIRNLYPDISYNDLYLKDYLTAPGLMPNISSVETPYQNIYKINPGSYVSITKTNITEHSYWAPSIPYMQQTCHNASQYGQAFRTLFEDCVNSTLHCIGNIGISLSSGLDSASVGALAASSLRKKGKDLYAYTYIPHEQNLTSKYKNHVLNETQDVKSIIAMHPNIIPHFLNNQGKNCVEEIQNGLSYTEIPYKACINLPNLCEIYENAYQAGCRVVLTGQCGNSTVSHGYIDDILYELYSKHDIYRFLTYLNRHSKVVKESRKKALKGCINYFNYTNQIYQANNFDYQPDNPFISSAILKDYPLETRYRDSGITVTKKVPTPSHVYHNNLYRKSMFTYLGELDTKLGLTHGIVLRDPTRDMRMLSFCYHLPYKYFAYKGTPRWLIRGNLRDLLPEKLLDNWMRYGVQNSDWHKRIERDWSTLSVMISDTLSKTTLHPWICQEKIEEYFQHNKNCLSANAENDTLYLLFLYNVSVFLQNDF